MVCRDEPRRENDTYRFYPWQSSHLRLYFQSLDDLSQQQLAHSKFIARAEMNLDSSYRTHGKIVFGFEGPNLERFLIFQIQTFQRIDSIIVICGQCRLRLARGA